MKQIFLCFFTSSGVLLSSQNLNAQTFEEEIWTGMITHPDGMTSDVRYDVKIIGFTLSITMKSKTMPDLLLDEISLGKEKLSFSYFTGSLNQLLTGSAEGPLIFRALQWYRWDGMGNYNDSSQRFDMILEKRI
jgi:hypothetical protein